MIKYILISLIVIVSIVISMILNKIYLMRERVYRDMQLIITRLIQEIPFRKASFIDCYKGLQGSVSAYTHSLIQEYIDTDTRKYLCSKSDFTIIYEYLDTVSMGDVDYAVANNKYYLSVVTERLDSLHNDYIKNGLLYIKLIVLLGVVIAILLI